MKSDNIFAAKGAYAGFSRAVRRISTSPRVAAVLRRVLATRRQRISPRDQLLPYAVRSFSQHGEDGILKELSFRLGVVDPYFVEFGVQDGIECNTRLFASEYRWSGLYIEGDPDHYESLERLHAGNSRIQTARAFITVDNIAEIFAANRVPTEFDVLSIDVDGNDFWFWKALSSYKPKIVAIEYNGAYPPPTRWIMKYRDDHVWDGTSYYGASLAAVADLGESLGYALVGTENTGTNAFFVKQDLVVKSGFKALTAEEAYRTPRYGFLGLPYPYKNGEALEGDAALLAVRASSK